MAFRFPAIWRLSAICGGHCAGDRTVGRIGRNGWSTEVCTTPSALGGGARVTYAAGVLSRIDEFDAAFFGISPREPPGSIAAAPPARMPWEAMESAGSSLSAPPPDCGRLCGYFPQVDYALRAMDDFLRYVSLITGNTLKANCREPAGPTCIDCTDPPVSRSIPPPSSSLDRLHQACNSLRAGEPQPRGRW